MKNLHKTVAAVGLLAMGAGVHAEGFRAISEGAIYDYGSSIYDGVEVRIESEVHYDPEAVTSIDTTSSSFPDFESTISRHRGAINSIGTRAYDADGVLLFEQNDVRAGLDGDYDFTQSNNLAIAQDATYIFADFSSNSDYFGYLIGYTGWNYGEGFDQQIAQVALRDHDGSWITAEETELFPYPVFGDEGLHGRTRTLEYSVSPSEYTEVTTMGALVSLEPLIEGCQYDNHGGAVSAAAKDLNDELASGAISGKERGAAQAAAAQDDLCKPEQSRGKGKG